MITKPTIKLGSGLVIGYSSPLATFLEPVVLEGGTHFLLARNGRGKSTLLRTIAGSVEKISGDYSTEGFMQFLSENLQFDPEITPSMIFRAMIPNDSHEAAFSFADRIELDVQKSYGKLSTGNRRKAALIMAEHSVSRDRGNILLLDEPFSGLDAFAREAFEELWTNTSRDILRLVSCHPDYDSMVMQSVLLIESNKISHHAGEVQKWSSLKTLLN